MVAFISIFSFVIFIIIVFVNNDEDDNDNSILKDLDFTRYYGDSRPYMKYTLPNGLNVILVEES